METRLQGTQERGPRSVRSLLHRVAFLLILASASATQISCGILSPRPTLWPHAGIVVVIPEFDWARFVMDPRTGSVTPLERCVLAVSRDRSRVLWHQASGPFYVSSPTFDNLEEIAELDAFDSSSLSLSPDGTRLAFVAPLTDVILDQGPGWVLHPYEVFIMDLRTRAVVQLTEEAAWGEQVHRVEWAPDGSRLLVETSAYPESVFTIRPDGAERTPKNLPEARFPNPTWSPDGAWIAYFSPEAVRVAADDGSTSRALVDLRALRDGGPYYGNTYGLAWSPDGEELAFSIHYPDTPDIEQNDAEVFVVEVRTGAVRRLTENASREDVLLWLPPPR